MARGEAARAFVQVRRHMACAAREEDKGGVWGGGRPWESLRCEQLGAFTKVSEASTLTPEQTCADKQTLCIRRRGRSLEGPEGAGR